MAKRRFANDNPFGGENEPDSSWLNTSSQIFGDIVAADSQVERIKSISIFDILPDPAQPRRAIPTEIRNLWNGTSHGIPNMFMDWARVTLDERGQPFDLSAYLEGHESERSKETTYLSPGPIEKAFLTVIDLAASIRRDGLTNPITVAAKNDKYQLETGERRWLAYHLLYTWFDGEEGRPDEREIWLEIKAREVKAVSVWRQANENNARANLNAIGKARQWAVLMIDLHGQENFRPFHRFTSEREYYAQAAELQVPYGKGEQLLNAMGVQSRSALTRYRKLLTLPDLIWQTGDDRGLSEELLYDLARLPHDEAMAHFRQTVLGQNSLEEGTAKETVTTPDMDYTPGTKRHFTRMMQTISKASHGKHKNNAQALKAIRELHQWLEDQEKYVMQFME